MGVAHVVVFAVVIFAQCGSSAATPLFRPEDAIIVEMSGPPSEPSRMPQKAERAPDVQRGTDSMEPMPPNASELALPDAKAQPGDDRADARQALLDEMRREYLLRDLDAPEGRTDRIATSADSKPGDGSAAHAGVRDPELAKWVKAAETSLAKNFHPLPCNFTAQGIGIANQAMFCRAISGAHRDPRLTRYAGDHDNLPATA